VPSSPEAGGGRVLGLAAMFVRYTPVQNACISALVELQTKRTASNGTELYVLST